MYRMHLRRTTLRSLTFTRCVITFAAALLMMSATPNRQISAADVWPGDHWERADAESVGMERTALRKAKDYAMTGGGSGYITRHGKLVMSWGDPRKRYDLKSTTKSFGATALGLAVADGKLRLADQVIARHPSFGTPPESNRNTNWIPKITILHLATHTSGFEKPGGYTKLLAAPGSQWGYSDGGPNWLAECITLAYRQDVSKLMFQRVFTPIGITDKDLTWRRNAYRKPEIDGITRREFGSGISANVDAMARLGLLYLRNGKWKDQEILPSEFVAAASNVVPSVVGLPEQDAKRYGNASDHYGLLWWNNRDGTISDLPRDAYWSWGLHESLIVVIPSLDIVASRAGKSWNRQWDGHYTVLEPFLKPIAASVRGKRNATAKPPREPVQREEGKTPEAKTPRPASPPPSPVIRKIRWAPPSTIVRKAKGSDNWPMTWGDDDLLYTAYGDGRGFLPYVEKKLSMGLCNISGGPSQFVGKNLRSATAERSGDGPQGPKASGILMVDGVLYLLVRNTNNSQLAWSADRGVTWSWSKWRFKPGFGYPTFLNFGKNYDGARDDFVYIYSHDSDSAYQRADHMILARVPKDKIRDREAYAFFVKRSGSEAQWTRHYSERGHVFSSVGRCYRSSVSYNAGLKRYLWCQTGKGDAPRFRGGFAIYDAPHPWGPWTTAFSIDQWDVGPGETSCLPTKWMSADGKQIHLVFSGDDALSVRQAKIELVEN